MEEAGHIKAIDRIFAEHDRSWLDLKEIPASDIDFQVSNEYLFMESQSDHAKAINWSQLPRFQTALNTSSGLDFYSAAAAQWDFIFDFH